MPKGRQAASAPPARRRDGQIERVEYVQTMRKDGKAKLKTPKRVVVFRPHVAQPKIQGRHSRWCHGACCVVPHTYVSVCMVSAELDVSSIHLGRVLYALASSSAVSSRPVASGEKCILRHYEG